MGSGGLLREPLYAGEAVRGDVTIRVCASPTDYPQLEIDGYANNTRQQFSYTAAHQSGEIPVLGSTVITITVFSEYTSISVNSNGVYIQRVVGIRAAE